MASGLPPDSSSDGEPLQRSRRLSHLPLAIIRHPHYANSTELVPPNIGLCRAQGVEWQRYQGGIGAEHPDRPPAQTSDAQHGAAVLIGCSAPVPTLGYFLPG